MRWFHLKVKDLLYVSVINTIRMNFSYFGWKGIFFPVIVASKNLKIKKLSGKVFTKKARIGSIKIGFGSVGIIDEKYRRSLWENTGTITFEGNADLCVGIKIACHGDLIFGDSCRFNGNSDIICFDKIKFGNNCLVSWECLFMDTDFHNIFDIDTKLKVNENKPILIDDDVWIGCRSTILKGAHIPCQSVVAACSTVTKRLMYNNCIYVSNDAKKKNIKWGTFLSEPYMHTSDRLQ